MRRSTSLSLLERSLKSVFCEFGKEASGNLPILLVTFDSVFLLFAWRMAPQMRCFQQSNCKEITSLFPKASCARRRTTQYENEVNWKGEDGQREDERKVKGRELVSKDVPSCLPEPPDLPL